MKIDGHEVIFMRNDGSIVNSCHVGSGGVSEDGEVCFWEIKDLIRPKLKGKVKYARIVIQRVYPYIKGGEE
jgi:hypothetical protein